MTPEEVKRVHDISKRLSKLKGTLLKLVGYIESVNLDLYKAMQDE